MPRTPEENDRIRRATTEQILQTALSLFCEKGYYSTSIEEMARGSVAKTSKEQATNSI